MPKARRNKPKKPILLSGIHTPKKVPPYPGVLALDGRPLCWRFRNADIGGPFSCGQFTYDDFRQFWDRLRAFEGMNPSELKQAQCLHGVPCTNISKEAKTRLEEIKKDDLDIIYGFHIMGECRLWCIKHENILSVLWWDRRHEVYPVGKKHT
jgi:hypothetical protein